MALTKSQTNGVINLFAKTFVNSNNAKERKKLFIDFEDVFGKEIVEWKSLCREKIREYASEPEIISCFDEFLDRNRKLQIWNDTYQVRLLKETDLEQVRQLINNAFAMVLTLYDDNKFEKFISSGYSVVACNEEEILGVALAYEIPDLNINAIYLDTFTVAENVRGYGLGRKMISHIQSLAVSNNIYKMKLQTDRKMEAYQIYKHWGFEEIDLVCMTTYFLKKMS